MTERKFTDEEVIKDLEHWCERQCKHHCHQMIDCEDCAVQTIKNALDLITRQKAEIDILVRKHDALLDEIAEKQAEIERLQNKYEDCAGCTSWKCDCANIESFAKAEATKEVFEEIDILVEDWKHNRIQSIQFIAHFTELKKKYTEDKQ